MLKDHILYLVIWCLYLLNSYKIVRKMVMWFWPYHFSNLLTYHTSFDFIGFKENWWDSVWLINRATNVFLEFLFVMANLDRCKRYILLSAMGTLLILGTLIFMFIPIKEYVGILRLTRGENFRNIKDVTAIIKQSTRTNEVEAVKMQYLNDSNTVNTRLSFCKNRDLKTLQLGGLFLITDPYR